MWGWWCVICVQAVLQYHPGLEFLADTPEFQARYAETVIYRIFYTINRYVQAQCRAAQRWCMWLQPPEWQPAFCSSLALL